MRATVTSVSDGQDLQGQRILITGANGLMGRTAALSLARLGADVQLACRTPAAARTLQNNLQAEGGIRGSLTPYWADLTEPQAILKLASNLTAAGGRLDQVLLCAGQLGQPFRLTEAGHEATYASTYLGHFLLLRTLVQQRLLAPRVRILGLLRRQVLSLPQVRGDIEMMRRPACHRHLFMGSHAHLDAQVLLALAACSWRARLAPTELAESSFNLVVPASTKSRPCPSQGPLQALWARLRARPAEHSAAPLIWATVAPELAHASGVLIGPRCRPLRLPARLATPGLAERSWDSSEALLNLAPLG